MLYRFIYTSGGFCHIKHSDLVTCSYNLTYPCKQIVLFPFNASVTLPKQYKDWENWTTSAPILADFLVGRRRIMQVELFVRHFEINVHVRVFHCNLILNILWFCELYHSWSFFSFLQWVNGSNRVWCKDLCVLTVRRTYNDSKVSYIVWNEHSLEILFITWRNEQITRWNRLFSWIGDGWHRGLQLIMLLSRIENKFAFCSIICMWIRRYFFYFTIIENKIRQ